MRKLLPPGPLAPGLFVLGLGAFAVSALRPKQVPPVVQTGADLLTATVVGIHPFEALLVRRVVKRKNVTKTVVRGTFLSSLVFGVFGTIPAFRAIRKASR